MALKPVVTDLSSVDESHRSLYVERDGMYQLDVEPVTRIGDREVHISLEDTSGLRKNFQSSQSRIREMESRLGKFGDINPEDVARSFQELETLRAESGDLTEKANKLAEGRVNQVTAQFDNERQAANKRIEALESNLRNSLVDTQIQNAILKAGGEDATVQMMKRHIADHVTMREVNGKYIAEVIDPNTGDVRIGDSSGNPMTIDQLVKEFKESDVYGNAWPGTGRQGLGNQDSKRKGPAGKTKKSQFTWSERADFIEANGAAAWIKLAD